MTDKTCSKRIRDGLGYTVDKKNWTRSQHQQALFCRALDGFPELYDCNHSDFKDLDKVEDSWKKLAVLRKKIYGADEAELKTPKELKEIWASMYNEFQTVYNEVCNKIEPVVPFELNLKAILTLGDERLSHFSHMIFVLVAAEAANGLLASSPGLKMMQRGVQWLVVHPDGKEEVLSDLTPASRKRLAKEVKDFFDDFPCRMRNLKDRKEAVVLDMELSEMLLVREIAKLNLDSDDDED